MITADIRPAVKCNGDYSIFLSFPYDEYVLDIVRELPDRSWHKEQKRWEIPINKLSTFLKEVQEYNVSIIGEIDKLVPEKKVINRDIGDYEFKTEPFEHQIEGFIYGMNNTCWLLADEQGLGKTKQVIDIAVAKKQKDNFNKCLIVCGVNGLKWNWQNEVSKHSNETGYILGTRYNKKGKMYIGSNNDRLEDLQNIDKIDSYFLITNVETLRNEKIAKVLSNLCEDEVISMVALDEAHKCKNVSSQQGKGILKLNPEYKIAMTGTPMMNTPLDLYVSLRWLGYEKHPFYQFRNHYCIMGGYGGYEIIGYRYLEDIREILNQMMLRRLKKDVLDLPDKLYVDEFVEMNSAQASIYSEILSEIREAIDKIVLSSNPLSELIRLRQATGFTGILSSTVEESAKLDRMEELIDEAVANDGKVIVFSNWTQITKEAERRLRQKYDIAVITGETKDEDRILLVDKFQTDDNCKVIIGSIGAMGTGLTLTAASTVILLDEPWNDALKEQAIDRCHRIGQNSNITIYTIMCKDTIDERIHEIVEHKGAMSDAIIDGHIRADKKELVNYLLS